MSHQPFETWNLDRESLTPEQRAELDRHVESCQVCQQMQRTWGFVQREFRAAGQKTVTAGFAARFQNSLEERRKLEHRRQIRRILTFLVSSIAFILTVLAANFLMTTPPADWIGSTIESIARVPFKLRELMYILTFWFSRIPPFAILALGAVPLTWAAVLITTGFLAYAKFHHQGEILR